MISSMKFLNPTVKSYLRPRNLLYSALITLQTATTVAVTGCSIFKKNPVKPVNHKPKIEYATTSPVTAKPGQEINLEALISDPDNDKLTAKWQADNTTKKEEETPPYPRKISYEYKADKPGSYTATLTVSDGKEEARHTWQINIGNSPPTIKAEPEGNIQLKTGQDTTITYTAHDPDKQKVTLTLLLNNTKIREAEGDTAKITYNYKAEKQGKDELKAIATDGTANTTYTTTITTSNNIKPEASISPAEATIGPGQTATYTGQATDPDNYPEQLTAWFSTPQGRVNGNTYIVKGSKIQPGTYKIRYIATDGQDTTTAEATLIRSKGNPPRLETNLKEEWTNLSQPYIVSWQATDPDKQEVKVNLEVILNQDTTRIKEPATGKQDLTRYIQKEGNYTIIITAEDTDSNRAKAEGKIHVDKTKPAINWETTETLPATGSIKATIKDASPVTLEEAELTRTTDNHKEKTQARYTNGTVTITYTKILYGQQHTAEITARDKAGNTTTATENYWAEQIFKEAEQPSMNEAGSTTQNLADLLKDTEITGLTITAQSSQPNMITANIQGLTITYTTINKDYNTEEYTPATITLTAKAPLSNSQQAKLGETTITPKVEAEPDVTFTLTPMLTPSIDPDFEQPPEINGRIIIAKLKSSNTTLAGLYDVPEDTPIDAYKSPISSKVTIDTTQITNGKAKIQLTPGSLYRWIIQADGYYERISGNKTLGRQDLEEKIELADDKNLPLAHTTTVAYGGNADEVTIFSLIHGGGISRIVAPFDSVYISLLPAKGSGNPVPAGWAEIIERIYQENMQADFMKTKLYPQGILHGIKIVEGTNPPKPGTPGVILWEADDTISGEASIAQYKRGFNNSEIYSIRIKYKTTGSITYRTKAVFIHEAGSVFLRSNGPYNSPIRSVFNWGSQFTEFQPSDKAVLHFLFSRPIIPDYSIGTDLKWMDRQY